MNRQNKRKSLIASLVVGLAIICVVGLVGLITFVVLTTKISGVASLPNGTTAKIRGPFSCSSNNSTTEISAGGHLFEFSTTAISVDGVPIGPFDATVTDVQIESHLWSASLQINGNDVPLTRR